MQKQINNFYWVMDGTNVGPYLLPPFPYLVSAKVSCQGDFSLEKKEVILMMFYNYYK